MRGLFVRLHRWMGLTTALFLAVAGLTGSIIAFNHELDEWLNPALFRVPVTGAALPALYLAKKIERDDPHLRVAYVPLETEPGHTYVFGATGYPESATGAPVDAGYWQIFVNPYTGAKLGEREWGAFGLDRVHLIPFLYLFHYSLYLPGSGGMWLMGIIAMIWFVDCFVGFCLTLPPARRSAAINTKTSNGRRSFLRRWQPSWKVKLGAGARRISFDLHRAGGLWLWGLLLTMAVSGVYLNLQFQVFRPLLSMIAPVTPSPFERVPAHGDAAATGPGVSFGDVVARARQVALRRGWPAPFDVFHSPGPGVYGVGFGDHHAAGIGVPWLYFDDHSGQVIGESVPGHGTGADVFMQWLFPLHSGLIAGLPGRIVVCITGVAVFMLSITGIVIWLRKCRARGVRDARSERGANASDAPGGILNEQRI